MLASFGFVSGSRPRFTAYQDYPGNGTVTGTAEEMVGFVMTATPDARGNNRLAENAFTVDNVVSFQSEGGEE